MKLVAWFIVVVAAIGLLVGPFLIGKQRSKYTATEYLIRAGICLAQLSIAGTILGWW